MSAAGRGALEASLARVLDALDWAALGEVYFHEHGEAALRERLPRIVELGLELADRLRPRLARGGASLWVGAGLAELPVLLAEVTTMGREVVAANLIERECCALNAALGSALPDVPVAYRAADARALAAERRFDHVGCISVFTDPETWPLLSGVAYGRLPPVQLDLERFAAERDDARTLAAALCEHLPRGGLITTTADEVAWFLEQAERRGVDVDASDDLVATAIVGDPVGFLELR